MDEVTITQVDERPKNTLPPYRWFIAVLADGNYYFITPEAHDDLMRYIGEHGGGLYTHGGFLVAAANKEWWKFLTAKYDRKYRTTPQISRPPHIDVPNIECRFSKTALKWLEDNEELLKEKGGKYYDDIPNH